jgi:hypothetical protein
METKERGTISLSIEAAMGAGAGDSAGEEVEHGEVLGLRADDGGYELGGVLAADGVEPGDVGDGGLALEVGGVLQVVGVRAREARRGGRRVDGGLGDGRAAEGSDLRGEPLGRVAVLLTEVREERPGRSRSSARGSGDRWPCRTRR